MICNNCGTSLPEGSKVCSNCGTPLETSTVQNNKPKSKLPIFIIVALVLIIAAFVGGLFFGKKLVDNGDKTQCEEPAKEQKLDDKDKDKDKGEEKYSYDKFDGSKVEISYGAKEDLSKNVEIYGYYRNKEKEPGKYEYINIHGKNNNSEPIKLKLSLQYFDANGVRLGEKNDSGNNLIKPNSEFVISASMMEDHEDYKSVKLIIQAEKKASYVTDIDVNPNDITVNKLSNGNIEATIKNSSDKQIKFGNGGFVFYKDGKVVYAYNTAYDMPVPAGGVSKATFYKYNLTNGKFGDEEKVIVEYDDVKFLLFSAFDESENY
jgi:predicted nucleic acid-binding Zn ribbon protein